MIITLQAESHWVEQMKSEITIREFSPVTMDEPGDLGGQDSAPTPMEYVLASLLGCTTVMAVMIAKEMAIKVNGLIMRAEGELNTDGIMGKGDVPPYFTRVKQEISIDSTANQEQLERLAQQIKKRCPVYNMLKAAGTVVEVSWQTGPAVH